MYNYSSTDNATTAVYFPDFAAENNNFSAAETEDWKYEQLSEHALPDHRDWEAARYYQHYCFSNYEPFEAGSLYYLSFPDFAPDKFYSTTWQRKAKARRALRPVGWGTRLFKQLGYPNTPVYFYSLHMRHLGLPVDYADPRYLYVPVIIQEIKAAIAQIIPAPYYWKLEAGNDGALHVHILGLCAPLLDYLIFEGSKVAQPIRPGTEVQLLAYLSKPPAPFTAFNYGIYLEAKAHKQTKQLPRLSGQIGIKKSQQRGRL
jgi:hypothetical protein